LFTIRSILDSKFNEIILNNDVKNISRFPEFVYGWLYTFRYSTYESAVINTNEIDDYFIVQLYYFLEDNKDALWVLI